LTNQEIWRETTVRSQREMERRAIAVLFNSFGDR